MSTIDWKSRAEAAEARANSFYRTFLETIRAFGGVAKDGLSDAFIQIGVPAEAAAVVKRMKAAEAERDALRAKLAEYDGIQQEEQARPEPAELVKCGTFTAPQDSQGRVVRVAADLWDKIRFERKAAVTQNAALRAALETIPVDLINAIENGEAPAKIFLSVESCKLIADALALTSPAAGEDGKDSARLKEAAAIAFAYGKDNEITEDPWWAVVRKNGMGSNAILAGPFFSRDAAEKHRKAREYEYGAKSIVFCFSGHRSHQYKELRQALRAAMEDTCEK